MPTTVLFANASNRSVSIFYRDGHHQIVTLLVAPDSAVDVKRLFGARFSIRTPESTFDYKREFVPGAYIQHLGVGPFMKRLVKAQLENDGCIYLIEPNEDIPARVHKAQPSDFPLCPRVAAKSD